MGLASLVFELEASDAMALSDALLEAAADLGAPPWRSFWAVTFPLSMPGVLAAFFMVFIPTIGEYVTPLLIGGSRGSMYGNIIQDFFTKAANWPRGAAYAFILLAACIFFVLAMLRLFKVSLGETIR